jgi:hypothetical protein
MSREQFMPVEDYIGQDNLAEYSFDFKITALSQLLIVVIDMSDPDNPEEIERVRGDDVTYLDATSTTFDAENGGGTIVLQDNLPTDYLLRICLADDEPTQDAEFRHLSSFTLKGFENALDRIAGAVQWLSWRMQRVMRLHDGYDSEVFDAQLPLTLVENSTIIISDTGEGFGLAMGPTTAMLESAIDAGDRAEAAATAAEASADAAELSAAAAVAAGFVTTGPFTVTEGFTTDLTGVLFSNALYNQVDFIARVKRGANVFSRFEFSIIFRDTDWELVNSDERRADAATEFGVSFTVDNTTGQVTAAVASDGEGDAEITLKQLAWTL